MIVTEVPTGPDVGVKLVILGVGITVKLTPLLATPATVTTTFPVVAPKGTGTTMPVVPQNVGVAVVPLNVTVLVPCDTPKLLPVIVTDVPTGPDAGLKLKIPGVTVKGTPLLEPPPTVTTTLPVVAPFGTDTTMLVALQVLATPAETPLKVTVLLPWDAPKLVPVIVTDEATGPELGLRVVIVGITVKKTLLLGTPPTVTITLPDVAFVGTGTTMFVALQLVGVAAVPLNVTVLVPCVAPKFVPVIVTEVPTGPKLGLMFAMATDWVVALARLE